MPANAKYWFRRVPANPVYEALVREFGSWDPYAFVDRCEAARGTGSDEEMNLRQIQRRECEQLFGWCFREATGRHAA